MALPARILVTGASGFIGRHLMPALRTAFPATVLLAGTRGKAVPKADDLLPLDLLDTDSVAAAMKAARPDAVIHLGAQAVVGSSFSDPDRSWRVNVEGSRVLAAALLAHAPQALMVLASSSEVYGLTFKGGAALGEDAAMAPTNPYAASKAVTDVALGEMALRGLRLIRLRLFSQVGAGQTEQFVVPSIARQIARAEVGLQSPVMRIGALDRWRDFVDVRDGCDAFIAALTHADDVPSGVAINIASGQPRFIRDILDALLARAGIALTVEVEASRLRPIDVERVQGDATRARQLLGWKPHRSWDQTLDLVLADWRARVRLEEPAR